MILLPGPPNELKPMFENSIAPFLTGLENPDAPGIIFSKTVKICGECILDATQCVQLKASLIELIDEEKDSLRFYYLGNKYKTKVEHIGIDNGIAADDVLIL